MHDKLIARLEKLDGPTARFILSFFGKKHVSLNWRTQFHTRHKSDTDLIHMAASPLGFFEIYDPAERHLERSILLSYAPGLNMPADVFATVQEAKDAALKAATEKE